MHTIIRDATTSKNDFVFYSDRLNRLLVEAGLGHLPFAEKTVVTPTGAPYLGVDFTRGICGVSIIRSGEAMETALRECCQVGLTCLGKEWGLSVSLRSHHEPVNYMQRLLGLRM
jgi:uracil phosphoribosyltransferase